MNNTRYLFTMKIIRYLVLILFICTAPAAVGQTDGMFNHKKERKRLWRRWNKKRDAYNPYLKKKNKDKPSVRMSRSEKREVRKQRRDYKRQLKRAKRNAR